MGRTKSLAHLLWSSMAVTGACGDDGVNRLPDAPPTSDAAPDAAPIPIASFAPLVSGATTCGEAVPATVNLAIENTGTADLVISAADATGGFLVMTTLPITIAPAGTQAIEIRPPAAGIGPHLGGSTKTGTLTLTTNEPTPTRTADLAVAITGANLELRDDAGQPIVLAFTDTTGVCPAPLAVFLHNSGNAPVEIIGQSAASGFAFGGFASGVIAPGASVQQDIRPFTTGGCAGTETITYQVTGTTLCNGDGSSASMGITATFNITGTSFCFCS